MRGTERGGEGDMRGTERGGGVHQGTEGGEARGTSGTQKEGRGT